MQQISIIFVKLKDAWSSTRHLVVAITGKVVFTFMTHYLTGECDSRIASIDPDTNSYKPGFQHEFDEVYMPTYMEIMVVNENGEKVIRRFDLARRRFVD